MWSEWTIRWTFNVCLSLKRLPQVSHSQVSFIIQLVWQTIGISKNVCHLKYFGMKNYKKLKLHRKIFLFTLSTRIWHMTFWSMTFFLEHYPKCLQKFFCYKKFWGLFGTGDEGNCMVLKLEGVPHDKLESYDHFCKALVTLDQNMYS